jgi:cysteinyl-tRNA synthetase
VEDMLETTRALDGQDEKNNKADFALWKAAPPEHIMRWQSPWGEGFPGWHIECSAMSSKYLGEEFDIHGGGMDLQFPHHESEIAQSSICHHGKLMARYWLHNNMITINGKKMGKSYNNVIKLTELFSCNHPILEQAYHPMVIRFSILQTHYRSTFDFSNEALQAAERGLKRLWEAYLVSSECLPGNATAETGSVVSENKTAGDIELDSKVRKLISEFDEFMNDDFNTAKVLANMFELVPVINGIKDKHIPANALSSETTLLLKQQLKVYLEDIFGLQAINASADNSKLDGVIQLLINIRKEARAKKDFQTSDKIRNELAGLGVQLKDEKDGSVSWSMN